MKLRPYQALLLLAVACWSLSRDAFASTTARDTVPQPRGREAQLLADGNDGQFEQFSLIEAALIAEGGESEKQLRQFATKFAAWQTELNRRTAQIGDTRRRAAIVHKFMHDRILTGHYEVGCSQLSRTIRAGDFNCVTATLVYLVLGRGCDLPLTAVRVPGHVRVRLAGQETLEIETTCPHWLPQNVQQPVPSTAEPSLPKTRESAEDKGRKLSDAALVAKIYYNRGIVLLDKQRFAQSVAATQAAFSLDPADEPTRKNLLAAYNNWALSLCQRGDFADAADMVVYALEIGPDFAPLVSNDLHVHQQWVLHLCETGRFSEALTVLQTGYRRRPDAELFGRGRDTVKRWWAESSETVLTSDVEMD